MSGHIKDAALLEKECNSGVRYAIRDVYRTSASLASLNRKRHMGFEREDGDRPQFGHSNSTTIPIRTFRMLGTRFDTGINMPNCALRTLPTKAFLCFPTLMDIQKEHINNIITTSSNIIIIVTNDKDSL